MSAITWHREAPSTGASRPFWTRFLHARRQDQVDAEKAYRLARRFIAAASNLGLGRHTESCAGMPGWSTVQVLHVTLGKVNDRMTVRLMPGQTVGDVRAVAGELAETLGVHRFWVTLRAPGIVLVELQRNDPLESRVDRGHPLRSITEPVLFGLDDRGRDLRLVLADWSHTLVQGQTRSGKSRWLYGLLEQVAQAPDLLITGSDITNLVLRPFECHPRHGNLMATGSRDISAHADVLEHLVKIMDDRIAAMPAHLDVFPCSVDDPWFLVLLEELPGLLKRASVEDAGMKPKGNLRDRITSAYGRLLAEGAKAGFRLLIVMQRADANIIGGYEREQCPIRISFPVGDPTAVGMLHPNVSDEMAQWHCAGDAGRALLTMPGVPYVRFRSPHMASYQDFRDAVGFTPDTPDPS